VPAECTSLQSHFVMPRADDAIYAGEEKIIFTPGTPRTVELPSGTAVFLRQGTAALAIRVPVARTLAGEAASVALVWDDNEWGAIRLTVDHRLTKTPRVVNAAAVFQVRVGSELNDAAFADFRRAFAATKCDVTIMPESLAVQSPAAKAKLALAAAAPWAQPSRIEPAPPRVVLEIDGQDVGRKILEAAR